MKKIVFLFAALAFVACSKESTDTPGGNKPDENVTFAVETGNSKLPYFKVTSKATIQNEPKVAATMELFENKISTLNTTIGIEYRGSTSFRLSDKKSYGIEAWDASGADTNISLLGYPEGEDFMFTGHVFRASNNSAWDPTLMHHYLGYKWYASMGHYASRSTFVDLELNDEYMGVYIFMEKLKEDNDRIDIDDLLPNENDEVNITGGYILKIDKTAGGDVAPGMPLSYYENNWGDDAKYTAQNSFRSSYGSDRNPLSYDPFTGKKSEETYFLYEYPKADKISSQQKQYIQKYINDFETALLTDDFNTDVRTYTQYIDMESFVDYFIINEITGNIDGYRLSTYMHKDKGGKLKMGPIWDLNIGYDLGGRVPQNDWIINYNTYVPNDLWLIHFWWKRLMEDPQFKAVLKSRWTTFRANVLSNNSVIGLIDSTSTYLKDNGAIDRNYNKWTGVEIHYDDSVNSLKNYMENRLAWMDQTINGM